MAPFSFPLLKTKFHMPGEERNLIERVHLLNRLDAGLEGKLILVTAPAGYGKTTLITQWLKRSSLPSAWVSLDENDNDLNVFLYYLISAIRTVLPKACPETYRLLNTTQALPGAILRDTFINEVSLLEELIIVLDDFHCIQDRQIQGIMTSLIQYLPVNLHLVIASRVDPNLLASLRAYRNVLELRSEDLGFTLQEAQAFLSQTLDKVSIEDTEELVHYTEGWIVGLRLAALSTNTGQDLHELTKIFQKGSYRFLMEYLSIEVLARQTPKIQEFLFQTAILNRFSASLYHSIQTSQLSEKDCHALLREVKAAGLFLVSLDAQEDWFRYHALFRDFLQYEVRSHFSKDDIDNWHLRAGRWLADHGWIEEALEHTFAAREYIEAARLVMQNLHTLLNYQDYHTLERWLAAFPPQQKHQHPALILGEAYLCYHHNRLPAIPALLDKVRLLLQQDGWGLNEGEVRSLRGNMDALQSQFSYWNLEIEQAQMIGARALANLPETHVYVRGTILAMITAGYAVLGQPDMALTHVHAELVALGPLDFVLRSQLNYARGLIYLLSGNYASFIELGEYYLQQEYSDVSNLLLGRVSYGLGLVYYERNNLNTAIDCWEKLLPLKYRINYFTYFQGLLGLSLAHQACGHFKEADNFAEKALEFAEEVKQDELFREAKTFQVRLALLRENEFTASPSLNEAYPLAYDFFKISIEISAITRILMLIAQNKNTSLAQASTLLKTSLGITQKMHNVPLTTKVLALQAIVYAKQKQNMKAEATLLKAVELAKPIGLIRTFLDLGPEMRDLLNQLANKGVARLYLLQILKAFPTASNQASRNLFKQKTIPHINLTTREFEILKLLAMRFSDKEIAEQLFISAQTVRRHTANIYAKLGVNNRREAVNYAHEWNLFSKP